MRSVASFVNRERNLVTRVAVGVVGAPAILLAIYLGGLWLAVLIGLAIGVALAEYYVLVRHGQNFPVAIALGSVYIAGPLILLWFIRQTPANGLLWGITLMMGNWATDTAAYAGGRLFGRHKLAPAISPNKTVEGAITGALVGSLIGWLILLGAGQLSLRTAPLPPIVAISVIFGDLLESAIKRRYAVKDASHLIPGHGGIMDRIDGTLVAAITMALYLLLTGGF